MRCNRLLGSSLFLFLNIGMIKIKLTCLRPLDIVAKTHHILLMEEILHYLGCIILVNNGMNYQPQLVNAGFQPSTVWKAGCIIWVFFKDGKPPTQDAIVTSPPGLLHPPYTNSKWTHLKNGCLEYDCFLLGFGLCFRCKLAVSFRQCICLK